MFILQETDVRVRGAIAHMAARILAELLWLVCLLWVTPCVVVLDDISVNRIHMHEHAVK